MDIAEQIVAAVAPNKLLDIKFVISPSSATRDEILAAALVWIKSAEEKIRAGTIS